MNNWIFLLKKLYLAILFNESGWIIFKDTVSALKGLPKFMQTDGFIGEYGKDLYINLKRISQDHVESYFSMQRQMCGETQNMTGYTYGYNINTTLDYSSIFPTVNEKADKCLWSGWIPSLPYKKWKITKTKRQYKYLGLRSMVHRHLISNT